MPWIIDEGKFNENLTLIDTNMLGTPKDTCIYLIEGTERTALIDAAGPQEAESCTKKLEIPQIPFKIMWIIKRFLNYPTTLLY